MLMCKFLSSKSYISRVDCSNWFLFKLCCFHPSYGPSLPTMVALEDKQVYENEQKLVVRYVSRECLLAIYSDSYLPFFFFLSILRLLLRCMRVSNWCPMDSWNPERSLPYEPVMPCVQTCVGISWLGSGTFVLVAYNKNSQTEHACSFVFWIAGYSCCHARTYGVGRCSAACIDVINFSSHSHTNIHFDQTCTMTVGLPGATWIISY